MLRHVWIACLLALATFGLSNRPCAGQEVLISELMASNARTLADGDGDYSDWVELYNPGTAPVSLNGWYLTDTATAKTKWQFPDVSIAAGGYMIVFTSDKNRQDPAQPLHTNWKLSAGGEYLGLIKPDGVTVVSEYAPKFPPQQTDVSYGMAFDGAMTTLVPAGAPARAIVPLSGAAGLDWTLPSFDDSGWGAGQTGIGYERSSGYESLIGLDLGAPMYNLATSAYIRVPFELSEIPSGTLSLRMKYDDGFVAYLNGVRVASANAPSPLAFNSGATRIHEDADAVQYQEFDVTAFRSALRIGGNVLAIQGLNAGSGSSDFLIMPELAGFSGSGILPDVRRYFSVPTPGGPNGTATGDQGPAITETHHAPNAPAAGESLLVTARVAPSGSPISTVTLTYRVNYGPTAQIAMADDGNHGDVDSGDGIYGATIPASEYAPGQMVRYFIATTDGAGHGSRDPLFVNPSASPEFYGTVVKDPAVVSTLPVLTWFVEDPEAAGTDTGTFASIMYDGAFYDNVHVRLRGQTSAGWPKKHYKIDMNSGYYFRFDPAGEPVEEFNLQSSYSDKSYIRQVLAWETYAKAGVPGCICFPVRVQQNGAFFSVGAFLEQPDTTMLSRNGLDGDGALYKMYNECTSATVDVEKKSRKTEDNSDLQDLVSGVQRTGADLTTYLFDNLDVSEAINYLAATVIMHDNDAVSKNYYLYRDTDGNGEWQILPWDKDLTFGRNFVPWDGGVLSDVIWADLDPMGHPFFGNAAHPKVDGFWNRLSDAIFREPTVRRMYLRRLRTLMDSILQSSDTPITERWLENRIDTLGTLLEADVALDRARWGNPYGEWQEMDTALGIMKDTFLVKRRTHLFGTHSGPIGLIPSAQTVTPAIAFGAIEAAPASGDPEEAFLELKNPGDAEADIRGWTLSGDISHTFRPGTVVPAHGSLYVARNVTAFRHRAVAPTGGMGLYVQGNTRGHLAALNTKVSLRAADGTLVAATRPTLADARLALAIAAGVTEATPEQVARLKSGDADGALDLSDAVALTRLSAGLD